MVVRVNFTFILIIVPLQVFLFLCESNLGLLLKKQRSYLYCILILLIKFY
jgi:hypothetical protein